MLDVDARGVFVISVTPFRDDGALDLDSTDSLVEFYAAAGCSSTQVRDDAARAVA